MQTKTMGFAALLMAVAIIFGAMGAHALRNILEPGLLANFKTAVTYQVWHSLAILIVGMVAEKAIGVKQARIISVGFVLGILFFSGSIYLLSLRYVLHIEGWASILGPITPLGGLFFIASWIYLSVCIFRHKSV